MDSPGLSGAEIVLLRLFAHLDRNRVAPSLLCDERNRKMLDAAAALGVACRPTRALASARDTDESGISWRKLAARVSIVRSATAELRGMIAEWRPHVIHANMYPACLYAGFAAWFDGVPLVWHHHAIRPVTRLNCFNYWLAGRLSSAIVNVSDACARTLEEAGVSAGKMHTIYNGIDLTQFDARLDGHLFRQQHGLEGRRLIGHFGQPLPEKGHRVLIEAAAIVARRHADVTFVIVGYKYASAYQRELDSLVASRGLSEHVIFTGWYDDVPGAMSAIEILAHTRVTPEAAGLVIQEAMALGKPVVSASTGGIPEIVVDGLTGLLVPAGDPERLAGGIGDLLDDPVRGAAMGREGRRRVEALFTLDQQVRKIEELYAFLRR